MMRTQVVGIGEQGKYDLFALSLPIWAFLWGIVLSFSFPAGSGSMVVAFLLLISIIALVIRKKVDKSLADSWKYFFLMLFCSIPKAALSSIFLDGSLYLAGWLICATICNADFRPKRIMKLIYIMGVVIAVLILVDVVTGIFSRSLLSLYNESARLLKLNADHTAGLFALSAVHGGFLVSGLGAGYFLQELKEEKTKWWYVTLVLYIFALIYINKRGFLLDLFLIYSSFKCINFFANQKVKLHRKGMLKTVFLLLMLIVIYFSSDTVRIYFDIIVSKFLKLASSDTTLSGRIPLYYAALRGFIAHPWSGIGWGHFKEFSLGVLSQTKDFETHNVYLQILCEAGIFGLITFLYAVFSTLLKTVAKYRESIQGNNKELVSVYGFSLFQQLLFITYGLSGNPLYDYNFMLMYFSGVIMMNYSSCLRRQVLRKSNL